MCILNCETLSNIHDRCFCFVSMSQRKCLLLEFRKKMWKFWSWKVVGRSLDILQILTQRRCGMVSWLVLSHHSKKVLVQNPVGLLCVDFLMHAWAFTSFLPQTKNLFHRVTSDSKWGVKLGVKCVCICVALC